MHNFLGNILVDIQTKYRKDRMKTEGAYSIWKKVDGRTERQTDVRTTEAPLTISAAELKIPNKSHPLPLIDNDILLWILLNCLHRIIEKLLRLMFYLFIYIIGRTYLSNFSELYSNGNNSVHWMMTITTTSVSIVASQITVDFFTVCVRIVLVNNKEITEAP